MNRRTFILGGLGLLGAAAAGGAGYLQSPRFGRPFRPERLARVQASPHYINGRFECLTPVRVMEGNEESFLTGWLKYFLEDKTGRTPDAPLPSKKTDLWAQCQDEDFAVWMGHSSFYLQIAGRRILIDPVFSSYASPVFFANRAFLGSNVYTAADIPKVDILIMSHDHWDHLDYPTILSLKDKIRDIVCPLGVGEYFEAWGFAPEQLHEEDWDTDIEVYPDFHVHVLPSQHFSGRLLTQNATQWASFAIVTAQRKVYYSGDGGYGAHFHTIGEQFGGFDLALLENGQYDRQWHRIHMLPDETAQAATDLRARYVLPAHNSKFALARHTWQAPMQDLATASKGAAWHLLTPEIGEKIPLWAPDGFPEWWNRTE